MWDVIIVGAGAAGLYTGVEVLRRNKDARVLILESYKYLGGRVVTHRAKGLQWEIGAGRISEDHFMTLDLVKRYDLTVAPIPSGSEYRGASDPFSSLIPIMLTPLQAVPQLGRHSLKTLLDKIHGSAAADQYVHMFPYYGEIHTLRADLAIHSFQTEFSEEARYLVCVQGYQAITDGLANEFKKLGGIIQTGVHVENIEEDHKQGQGIVVRTRGGETFEGSTCVLALHADALRAIPFAKQRMPALRHLKMEPLVRMYAVFPPTRGHAWFEGLPKQVFDGPVRYMIPINPAKGLIMISYTDGLDAQHWIKEQKRIGDEGVGAAVLREIRATYPDRDIPDPTLFKIYPWTSGCTYWTPGDYDPVRMSQEAMILGDRVFACGESISLKQAWVEGALESAEALLGLKAFRKHL